MWIRIAQNPIRTLAVVAAVAGLSASPARADHDRDRDEGRDHWRGGLAPVVVVAPAPAHPAPRSYVPAPPAWTAPPWRVVHWRMERRVAERRELRHEYAELESARTRFYARWNGRPWTRDRFESWYAARRADLDARAAELERWRG